MVITGPKVWIFNGEGGQFPSAVFEDLDQARRWIAEHELSGTLTCYPVGVSAYDWAVREGAFRPKGERHQTPRFIQTFSSACQEHYHFRDGSE